MTIEKLYIDAYKAKLSWWKKLKARLFINKWSNVPSVNIYLYNRDFLIATTAGYVEKSAVVTKTWHVVKGSTNKYTPPGEIIKQWYWHPNTSSFNSTDNHDFIEVTKEDIL